VIIGVGVLVVVGIWVRWSSSVKSATRRRKRSSIGGWGRNQSWWWKCSHDGRRGVSRIHRSKWRRKRSSKGGWWRIRRIGIRQAGHWRCRLLEVLETFALFDHFFDVLSFALEGGCRGSRCLTHRIRIIVGVRLSPISHQCSWGGGI